jgi:hypothetical protein
MKELDVQYPVRMRKETQLKSRQVEHKKHKKWEIHPTATLLKEGPQSRMGYSKIHPQGRKRVH